MSFIRPDPLGVIDILAGVLLYLTVSPVPPTVSQIHAGFLIFKGTGSMVKPLFLPLPVYVLGGAADLMSAMILFTGKPPILADFKLFIGGFLFLKGLLTFLSFMQG